jgi:hypothetical protein
MPNRITYSNKGLNEIVMNKYVRIDAFKERSLFLPKVMSLWLFQQPEVSWLQLSS